MKINNMNIDTVIFKESFANSKKINIKNSIILFALAIVSLYFSATFWTIFIRGGNGKFNSQSLLLNAAIISIVIAILYFILRLPISLFLSKINKHLLYLPIKPYQVLLTRYKYLFITEIVIIFIISTPVPFLTDINLYTYIGFFIYLSLLIAIINYLLIILLLILGIVVSRKFIHIAFISASIFSSFILSVFLKIKGIYLLSNIINIFFESNTSLKIILILMIYACTIYVLHTLTIVICNKYFRLIYQKTSFINSKKSLRKKIYDIKNPYIFLELRFLLRNKSFFIYSILKSLLLMFLVIKLITNTIVVDNSEHIIICIVLISCFNPLSVTAISRDLKQIRLMKSMPINYRNVVFSKIIVSALINFIICLIVQLLLYFKYHTPIITYIIFNLIYSVFSSTIGAYIDLINPNDTYDNLNDLIRNNSSTLTQFIIGIIVILSNMMLTKFFSLSYLIISIALFSISIMILKQKKVVLK